MEFLLQRHVGLSRPNWITCLWRHIFTTRNFLTVFLEVEPHRCRSSPWRQESSDKTVSCRVRQYTTLAAFESTGDVTRLSQQHGASFGCDSSTKAPRGPIERHCTYCDADAVSFFLVLFALPPWEGICGRSRATDSGEYPQLFWWDIHWCHFFYRDYSSYTNIKSRISSFLCYNSPFTVEQLI